MDNQTAFDQVVRHLKTSPRAAEGDSCRYRTGNTQQRRPPGMTTPYTPQQVFDTVARHLLLQKGRAYDEGACQYRDKQGRKCAIGCLIPDEMYLPDMEGMGVLSLLDHFSQVKDLFDDTLIRPYFVGAGLLTALQTVHDGRSFWSDNKFNSHGVAELRLLAKEHALSTTVLDDHVKEGFRL